MAQNYRVTTAAGDDTVNKDFTSKCLKRRSFYVRLQQRIIDERNKYFNMQCQIFKCWENTFFTFSDRPTIWQSDYTSAGFYGNRNTEGLMDDILRKTAVLLDFV